LGVLHESSWAFFDALFPFPLLPSSNFTANIIQSL
jgi:hypothetical protein